MESNWHVNHPWHGHGHPRSVVPHATITLTNVETNAVRSTKSTDTGTYVFDLITPAQYRLEVEAKGFKKNVVDRVEALIGKPTETDVSLDVGTVTEVVEVISSSQQVLINTQDATPGNNFDSLQITQLPLEARSVVDLLSLQPGATREGYITGARARGNWPAELLALPRIRRSGYGTLEGLENAIQRKTTSFKFAGTSPTRRSCSGLRISRLRKIPV